MWIIHSERPAQRPFIAILTGVHTCVSRKSQKIQRNKKTNWPKFRYPNTTSSAILLY